MQGAKAIRPLWSVLARAAVKAAGSFAVPSLCGVLALSVPFAQGASPIRFSGELGGLVTDIAGRPQPGAVVLLYNRQDVLLQRVATDALGSFAFGDLLPDLYSLNVSLSSFVPAMKERIQIRPGMRSLLEINLSRVFSSVQVVSTTPVPGGLMNDNWKWALRADSATRPILRILPPQQRTDSPSESHIFTDSRGLVKISASDGASVSSDGQGDLGTQFAFATSVYGGNRLQVAGDVGYASGSTAPSAAIRTTYSRELMDGVKPEVSVTMRQFFVPLRVGQSLIGSPQGDGPLPALRTVGVSFDDKAQLTDSLQMEYGFAFDNVSFLDSLHYFSPYGKLIYALPRGKVDFTWTSGNARPELGMATSDPSTDLQRDLATLAVLPRVTLMDGHAKVQRGDDFELGISQRFGSREYRLAGYHERVANTTLTLASADPALFPGDQMPDLFSNSSLFNMGKFDSSGYTASVTQDLGDNYKVTLIYGSQGVVAPRTSEMTITTADDLRRVMEVGHRPALTLRISGALKSTGTRVVASYQWTDYQSATPGPLFSTESARPEPGLNVVVRQPMPAIPRMPWRMEASAELRNLLAQGYLPLMTSGGDQFLLINTPRIIRGGIAFVF
ncbi:MAG TPA: carboxypeptidase-like regulatory domain-containing protein [Bryobacteraceae bacterium]|nr:carboxypeptidase-like regulatory domain-containing protein [Bryobacteraceae bacterium]